MKLTQKGFLRIYNINFLLVTLAFLSLMRIAYSQRHPSTGLYFMFKGKILFQHGGSVLISDIKHQDKVDRGNPGDTLVCVTTNINTACCRSKDNNNVTNATAGVVGEWYYPDGTLVPRSGGDVIDFVRVVFTHQLRLAREVSGSTPPLGVYTCEVPHPSTGVLHNASITILKATTGLYFILNNVFYLPGESVLISDIGPQPFDRSIPGSTLVCVTTNVNTACCKSDDNNAQTNATAGAVGEWLYPNGTQVPHSNGNVTDFARIGGTHQIRLARQALDSTPQKGVFTCQVPEPSHGVLYKASISLLNGSSMVTNDYNIATFTPSLSFTDDISVPLPITDSSLTTPTSSSIATTEINYLNSSTTPSLSVSENNSVPLDNSLTTPTSSSVTTIMDFINSSINTEYNARSTFDADIVNVTLSTTNDNTEPAPMNVVTAVVIILALIAAVGFVIVLLLVLLRKKMKNKNSESKNEPDYYYAKSEAGAEAVYASPLEDYYSTIDKDHGTSDPNEKDGHYAHVSKELHNSKESNVVHKHDDVDVEVTQMYSVVDKSAKKEVKHGQAIVNDISATECQDFSDMYAVVDKNAVKKSQNCNVFDEYAVVDKSVKIKYHTPENAGDLYAVVNKSGKKKIMLMKK